MDIGNKKSCGNCSKQSGCSYRNISEQNAASHLGYHRPRRRSPSSSTHVFSFSSRPTSPLPNTFGGISPIPGIAYHGSPLPPPVIYSVASPREEGPLSSIVPAFQSSVPYTPQGHVYSVPNISHTHTMGPPYYTGAPYVMLQPNSATISRAQSPMSLPDMEEFSSRPRWDRQHNIHSSKSSTQSSCSDKEFVTGVPSLRVPVSSLPSPQDAAGIPVQDLVCPFHQLSSTWSTALKKNQEVEFERNKERFLFLKWGSLALKNMLIVPPGSGIVHQVNLEYLARVVFEENNHLYPDSLVGTDSHTTMINGLGVVGWGVGGIEAEAVMLGQAISMVLPEVVGYKIVGKVSSLATSTDVVLTITKHLRQIGVVGKFVEFFGEGVNELSLADRATISNMCPEYGATIGYFPVDEITLMYLRQTNREERKIKVIESYLKAVKMFRDYSNTSEDPVYSQVVELNLGEVVPSMSGPKRPHDKVAITAMKDDFQQCLINKPKTKAIRKPLLTSGVLSRMDGNFRVVHV